jgi:hypothetical protein
MNIAAVATIVRDKLRDVRAASAAVLLGRLPQARGGLMGSNGDEVWAIVRDNAVVTVMLRRSDQPKTRQALRVDWVAA